MNQLTNFTGFHVCHTDIHLIPSTFGTLKINPIALF